MYNYYQGWEFALWFFNQITRFLWVKEWNSDKLLEKSSSLLSLFCREQQEQIAHGPSFVKSYGSHLLTVTLLLRETRANCSRRSLKKSNGANCLRLLFKMSDFERKREERRAKQQILILWSTLLWSVIQFFELF